MNQCSNGNMQFRIAGKRGEVRMGIGRVLQNPHDFAFGQHIPIIQRQQKGFANGKGGGAGNVMNLWHFDLLL